MQRHAWEISGVCSCRTSTQLTRASDSMHALEFLVSRSPRFDTLTDLTQLQPYTNPRQVNTSLTNDNTRAQHLWLRPSTWRQHLVVWRLRGISNT
jgi:hypothetical protein